MRSVQRMVDEEAYCVDVLTQIASVVSTLEKVAPYCSRTPSSTASASP